MHVLLKLADNRRIDSLAAKLRRKRFDFFKSLVATVPRPLRILDVGGTQAFWEAMSFCKEEGIEIVLLNLQKIDVSYPNVSSVVGDARDLKQFGDQEFDVVFSNSVIEHVGALEDQIAMANEVRRVGKRLFIQTPNRYFPVEPHFLVPYFQLLPISARIWLVSHFRLGWSRKLTDKRRASEVVTSVRMLSKKELKELFPRANIARERFMGLVKSFIVYVGWDGVEYR